MPVNSRMPLISKGIPSNVCLLQGTADQAVPAANAFVFRLKCLDRSTGWKSGVGTTSAARADRQKVAANTEIAQHCAKLPFLTNSEVFMGPPSPRRAV